MVNMISQFEGLSTKVGFNNSLKHFRAVMKIIGDISDNINLADILTELIEEKAIISEQIQPILNSLLVDKYTYSCDSYNLKENVDNFDILTDELKKWTAVDVLLAYYSPEMGLTPINPKNREHLDSIRVLKRNELITIYVGELNHTRKDKKIYSDAIIKIIQLLDGKKITTPSLLTGGRFKAPVKKEKIKKIKKAALKIIKKSTSKKSAAVLEPVAAQQPPAATKAPVKVSRMTPMYGIVVANELFHNGNVEAWKKIIESFEYSHAGLKVFVYYDGEQIHDLNTLFKWGKVKRGTAIMISVGGDNIRNVSKLQKYLRQGASHMFEAFLKGHPHQVLKLF